MLVAAIETATFSVGVAVGRRDGTVLGEVTLAQGRRHAESLVPSLDFLLALLGATVADIGLVAVDSGPGLFTGLRVGVATAKALAHARGIRVAPVCSLAALAHDERLRYAGNSPVAALLDARRGELYASIDGGSPFVAPPAQVASLLPKSARLIGDAHLRYPEVFAAWPAVDAAPSAAVLLRLADDVTHLDASDVTLTYLRPPDAEINWKTR